jgi:hypothetical protein
MLYYSVARTVRMHGIAPRMVLRDSSAVRKQYSMGLQPVFFTPSDVFQLSKGTSHLTGP